MIDRRRFFGLAASVAAGGALSGCGSVLEKPFPEKRYYVLDARREPAPPPAHGLVLGVRRYRVSPGYEGKGLVTHVDGLTASSDFYNEFFVEPAAMLEDLTSRWLASAGIFRSVVPLSSQLDPDMILEGALVSLYGDYGATGPAATIDMQFLLLDIRKGGSRIVDKADFRQTTPLKDRAPGTLIQGWNAGLAAILGQLEGRIRGVVAQS